MNKILTIIGARPQFVKAATVSREIAKTSIREIIVHTGQHFDKNMSDIFFEEMDIPQPDYNLAINSMSHGAMTGKMLEEIEKILKIERPDAVMVYGDTNSTIAGALAAKKMNIRVVHVEAGLRSFNMEMPEEINRILTDRISDILFCPTNVAVLNLVKEGFENIDAEIVKNGDVMQDAAIFYSAQSEKKSNILFELELVKGFYVLATVHRQENTDNPDRLQGIINALNEINKDCKVIVPLHPRTRKIIKMNNLNAEFSIIDPVGYFDILELIKGCKLVMTDSGGLQKEAFFFEKNCVTMRDQTEWVELVDGGFNSLCGANKEEVLKSYHIMKNKSSNFNVDLYGNGNASKAIVDKLLKL